jgi:chromosome segregation protein
VLKLKKLQILGFKSFCDRTEVKFPGDGIACIVGPNGCGKSNIADAISWVLGEQSAKTLRGSRMQDVIFAGTRDRIPTGMAEVSLTLVDPEQYEGSPAELEAGPEIEIRDEMPQDDWDEAAARVRVAQQTEAAIQEVQPGQLDPEAEPEAGADLDPGSPEVVLKVRRRKMKAPELKSGVIVVTRRLFRSGESEYLLNGKLCRLRDIQDLFMGTGLGPESYAIIEQGRIGQILSSRPTDRRAILEEAAGITKFKTRKRLAEMRLEQAQQNLARINDIFEEVTRQMNSLKRQASKAERYVRLREEMRAKFRLVLASKFSQLEQDARGLDVELERIATEMKFRGESLARLEGEHNAATQRGYAIESEALQRRERLSAITLEIDRGGAQRRHNEERCAELEARSIAAQAEIQQVAEQLATLEGERDQNRGVLESAAADVAAAQQEAQGAQQAATAATTALSDLELRQEQLRVSVLEAVNAASTVRNQMAQAEEYVAALEREAQRHRQEIGLAQAELQACDSRRGQLALEFDSASQRVAGLAQRIADARRQLEEKRAAEQGSKLRLDGLRAEFASALGRKSSLESLVAEHGYSTESVKRLFQSGVVGRGFASAGVLADFLEVDDQYEPVVEDFLRDELNYVVVKSWDAADHGLQLLRTDVDGRATFLVHPDDSQAKFSFLVDESAHQAPQHRSNIVPLKNCIRVLNGFGKSLEVILPKLRDGYIVPDPKVGRELALENPDAFFLSRSGECFHNVTVTGGKQRSEGPLSLKRELRELTRQIAEMEDAVRMEDVRAATLGREIAALTSLLDKLEQEKREEEKLALTSGASLEQVDSELARGEQRRQTAQRDLERVQTDRGQQETALAALRHNLEGAEQQRQELEQAITAAQESLGSLRAGREAAAQRASECLARVAALEERRAAAAGALGRIESLVAEVSGRVASVRTQMESAAVERAERQIENLRIGEQLVALAAEQQAVQARVAALQAESESLRQRLAQIEQELKSARQAQDAARDRRGEVSAQAAKLRSDAEHMAETCMNELGVTSQQLLADPAVPRVSGEQLAQEDAIYHEMRAKLDAMGPVNMMALEEYNETAQRHGFLEGQRKDLMESITNTQNTIREIDQVSRQKFQEAFEKINENFQRTFRKLFGGGHAFMRLTDEENSAESGIDVVASPPGKKLQNVLLLSGGEKALTALSLLVGIFQYQPSPFCILDEVDAPLDEANIGRFTELVREMSVQTQFVLITHSKKTMSVAPVMYGVTMQEPGVSKLVSVRFGEEARA